MSPSRPFILRPVATSLLMAGILLVGAVAYKQLPVSALPQVDYPTIQVMTFYPGASPDVMASSITAPLERQFGQVPGQNQRRPKTRGADPGQSDGAVILPPEFGRSARGHRRGQRKSGQGQLRRPAQRVHDRRERSDSDQRGLSAPDRRVPQRRAGDVVRGGRRDRRRGEREAGRMDERHSGGDRQYSAAARRQHHRSSG